MYNFKQSKINSKEIDQQIAKHMDQIIPDSKTIQVLKSRGIKDLFPIQKACFQFIYNKRDLIGKDSTGSGKTLAFLLPLIERFRKENLFEQRTIQALILLPTRELCIQVCKELQTLKHTEEEFVGISVYGGTDIQEQIQKLKKTVHFVVGTPGRILDQYDRGNLKLAHLKTIILDEADQMLEIGFKQDIEQIIKFCQDESPNELQYLFFSATVPSWLIETSQKHMRDQVYIDLVKEGFSKKTDIEHLVMSVPFFQRSSIIGDIITVYGQGNNSRVIIFTQSKKEANDILVSGNIKQECQVLHGDIPQKQREITFKQFKEGQVKVLISTNVAARGLDIPHVDLVIQLDPPNEVDTYVHRAGRTGRAGQKGVCITFFSNKTQDSLFKIEKRANIKFQKVGIPQPQDLIKANQQQILQNLYQVSSENLAVFEIMTQNIIEKLGAEEALKRAISLLAGYSDNIIQQRSLIMGLDGYFTIQAKFNKDFDRLGFAWGFFRKVFSNELQDSIKGLQKYGENIVIFDVQEKFKDEIEQVMKNESMTKISFLKELNQELKESKNPSSQQTQNIWGKLYMGDISKYIKLKSKLEICVGGLDLKMQEDDLNAFFKQHKIQALQIRILRNEQNQSKGIGFCLLENEKDVQKALSLNGSNMGYKKLRINMAKQR